MDPKEAANIEEEKNKLKILFELAKNKVDNLIGAVDSLDGKAGALMRIEVTLMIAYSAYSALIINDISKINPLLGAFGLLLLIISAGLLLRVISPKGYSTISPNLEQHPEYLDPKKSEEDLLLQLISDAQDRFTNNNYILEKKFSSYRWAVKLFVFGALLLATSFILIPLASQIFNMV